MKNKSPASHIALIQCAYASLTHSLNLVLVATHSQMSAVNRHLHISLVPRTEDKPGETSLMSHVRLELDGISV